jgi:hypothetical protein
MKKESSALLIIVLMMFFLSIEVSAQKNAPANIAAALTYKVIKYEKNIESSGEISIYVLGAADIQSELKKGIDKQIGSSILKSVDGGDGLPASKPSVLFVGSESSLNAALDYSREHKVLTVTNIPGLVALGATLGIGIGDDGKPCILINLTSSVEENLNWNAAIMKVAKTIK